MDPETEEALKALREITKALERVNGGKFVLLIGAWGDKEMGGCVRWTSHRFSTKKAATTAADFINQHGPDTRAVIIED